ncbi:hypothetical protein Bbelb_376300 [Branchiostoma belcheri]|nr:hypothetical protein Bbelb_376300 [Branchiostoma belcheri]
MIFGRQITVVEANAKCKFGLHYYRLRPRNRQRDHDVILTSRDLASVTHRGYKRRASLRFAAHRGSASTRPRNLRKPSADRAQTAAPGEWSLAPYRQLSQLKLQTSHLYFTATTCNCPIRTRAKMSVVGQCFPALQRSAASCGNFYRRSHATTGRREVCDTPGRE